MKERLCDRIRQAIINRQGRYFSVNEIYSDLIMDGPANHTSVRVAIARDMVGAGEVERVSRHGKEMLYRETNPDPNKKFTTGSLIDHVVSAIKSFGGRPFTNEDIIRELTTRKIDFNPRTAGLYVGKTLKDQGLVKRIEFVGVNAIYQECGGADCEKKTDPIVGRPETAPKTKNDDRPQKAKTKTDIVREIIDGFNGQEFTIEDVEKQLAGREISIGRNTLTVMLTRELCDKAKYLERTGRRGRFLTFRVVGQDRPTADGPAPAQKSTKPVDPPPVASVSAADRRIIPFNPGTLTAAFNSVAAGLEKFSLEYITTEIQKTGDWKKEKIKKPMYFIVSKLKQRGLITATNSRPTIYQMTGDFYLYNLHNLISYTETAPHLEQKIMLNFGRHCQDKPVENDNKQIPPIETKLDPPNPPEKTTNLATLSDQEREKLLAEIEQLKYKIDDRNINLINMQSRVNTLESKTANLNRQVGRLTQQLDEKTRTNAALQRRLNITMGELKQEKRRHNQSFSLGEMAHMKI